MTTDASVVILISAGRSGSKYVRDLLAASRSCAVVPFDINHIWRHGNEHRSDDVLDAASIDSRHIQWIRDKVLGLAARGGSDRPRIVVEKTVSNSLRVPFVRAIFPEAKLVHLIRDGRAAAESARRVWNERPSWSYAFGKLRYLHIGGFPYLVKYAANQLRTGDRQRSTRTWGPRYPGMETDLQSRPLLEVCGRQWLECLRRAESGLGQASSGSVMTIRYEDVVAAPGTIAALCEFAGIQDRERVEAVWRLQTDRSNVSKWQGGLTPDEAASLTALMRPDLGRLGYPC